MLKPAEIGNIEFTTSFRGYNPDQVDEYVDDVVKHYTEAYNAGAELEKKCKEQKSRILELEAELEKAKASSAKVPPVCEVKTAQISQEDVESVKSEYEEYKKKAALLRDTIKAYKEAVLSVYQKQISGLREFDFDGIDACLDEREEATETVLDDNGTVPEPSELSEDDQVAHLVSELDDLGSDGQPYHDDTDVSSLIDDISEILNAGIDEVEVKNTGSSEKNEAANEDADYTNDFNRMFITDDIG